MFRIEVAAVDESRSIDWLCFRDVMILPVDSNRNFLAPDLLLKFLRMLFEPVSSSLFFYEFLFLRL